MPADRRPRQQRRHGVPLAQADRRRLRGDLPGQPPGRVPAHRGAEGRAGRERTRADRDHRLGRPLRGNPGLRRPRLRAGLPTCGPTAAPSWPTCSTPGPGGRAGGRRGHGQRAAPGGRGHRHLVRRALVRPTGAGVGQAGDALAGRRRPGDHLPRDRSRGGGRDRRLLRRQPAQGTVRPGPRRRTRQAAAPGQRRAGGRSRRRRSWSSRTGGPSTATPTGPWGRRSARRCSTPA